ncbi:MAG: hypothetical protein HFE82_06590 [Erysipelotrichaceae bacterium]|nr:hypothetical protein [Erysipelotrichaceae bacterium]
MGLLDFVIDDIIVTDEGLVDTDGLSRNRSLCAIAEGDFPHVLDFSDIFGVLLFSCEK